MKRSPRKPREVAQVHTALVANARTAGGNSHSACCHFAPATPGGPAEWLIGPSVDGQAEANLVYREGLWFRRTCADGVDHNYTLEKAMADAACWFTG